MQGPDSTQTDGTPPVAKENGKLRFIKPNVGENSDLMPVEAEIDQIIEQLEPPRYFVRMYGADGELKNEIPLKKYVPNYVGRSLGCQIDLVEPSISRRHCVFQYKDLVVDSFGETVSGFMIYDLKSCHGTFLNGERIPSMENIKLLHGDKITLGQCIAVFTFWDSKYMECQEQPQEEASQPSSTSQVVETETNLNENDEDTWLIRYIKVLNQLADAAKEYEEYGIPLPNFDKESRLAKKFKLEHTKFVQQAQTVAELLGYIGSDEPIEMDTPVPRRKKKENTGNEEGLVKRPRKNRKVEKRDDVIEQNDKYIKKKRKINAIQDDIQPLQKEVQTPLVQTSSLECLTDNLFDGVASIDEEDPLALTQQLKIEEVYEDQNEAIVDKMVAIEERAEVNSLKPPGKKRGRKKKILINEDDYQMPVNHSNVFVDEEMKPKKRARHKKILENNKDNLQEPVIEKKKRGRKPKALKDLQESSMTDVSKQKSWKSITKIELSPPRQRRAKKLDDTSKTPSPLKPIDNNSPKQGRGRGRQKKHPQSPETDRKAIRPPVKNNINSPSSLTINQPIVLLQKLELQKCNWLHPKDPLEI